ncbi:MAG: WYL domain-containing protein [Oscillospiraceae bacterium]|jgi:hypothetical protein|nr:WYL domain-containing protein [Oscillospiraceae bacterium]
MMLFSEVYSAYFNAIAAIVREVQRGELTEKSILQIIGDKAFSESMLSILPAIKKEEWLVMNSELKTPIAHTPQMPLTILQKRWLSALLTDPRIALFDVDASGFAGTEPLFTHDDFVFFERYADGDPYTDEHYIAHFKIILTAMREQRRVHIKYRNRNNKMLHGQFIPYRLEYSAKDDKFRLETAGGRYGAYINLARIDECKLLAPYEPQALIPPRRRECRVAFSLLDERNALDRVMLHFSDCRKETRKLDERRYEVQLWYEAQDETEILIRILSFGQMIRVTAPDNFIGLIKQRLAMQRAVKQ